MTPSQVRFLKAKGIQCSGKFRVDTLLRSYHVRKSQTLCWKYLIVKAKFKKYHDLSDGKRKPRVGESPGVLSGGGLGAWMSMASLHGQLPLRRATQSLVREGHVR